MPQTVRWDNVRMNKPYVARFGADRPLRFVARGTVLYVSKADFIAAARDCFALGSESFAEQLLHESLQFLGDTKDQTGAVIDDAEIGPVVHWHLAGNLLANLAELRGEANAALRETAYRTHTFMLWFSGASSEASNFFGIGAHDILIQVGERLDRVNPPFIAEVEFDAESEMWIASCEAIGAFTEAPTYEALQERFWDIAPDIAQANGVAFDENTRVRFQQTEAARQHFVG